MLTLWQGERAAFAYCWLLVDNARNLPAFYGLPLPWDDLDARLLMTSGTRAHRVVARGRRPGLALPQRIAPEDLGCSSWSPMSSSLIALSAVPIRHIC